MSVGYLNCLMIAAFLWLGPLSLQGQSDAKTRAEQYFQKGEEAMKAHAFKTALAHYNECLRLNPYLMEAYHSRGRARERMGDSKGALTDYNIYLESKPADREALFTRALLRYEYGQWAMAREDFLMLLKSPQGETNTVFFQVGKKDSTANKMITAQGDVKPLLYNYLGLVDSRMKNYKRAMVYLDSAIKVQPKEPDFYINRGMAKQLSGDTLAAVSDYKQTLALDPENSLARHNLAVLTATHVNAEETEKLLTEAIEKNPKIPYSYAERGFIRMKSNKMKGAFEDFSMAIQLDPKDPDYWLNRGIVKEKLKDPDGALADYTQAIRIKGDFEKAWLNRGNLLTKQNRMKEAIEDYTVAITNAPEYGLAYYNRALAQHKSGNPKEACKDLLQAQKLGVSIEKK